MLRPASTRWFEVLCARAESVRVVTALARTGSVELELRRHSLSELPIQHLAERLADFQALSQRYARYWSRGRLRQRALTERPSVVLRRALAQTAAWRREADPLVDLVQECEEELTRLKWLARIIETIAEGPLPFGALARCGPILGSFCAILPRDAVLQTPDWVIPRRVPWELDHCYMFLAPFARLDQLRLLVQGAKGRIIDRPSWLRGDARDSLGRIRSRREFLSTRVVHLYAELDALFEDYDLGHALGEVSGLLWFAEHVEGLERASENLAWITGWTDDLSGEGLAQSLSGGQVRALLRLRPPPPGLKPPQVLDNPRWIRPFEVFAQAFGVPGRDEADPTPVLAVVVPLLFGYMFADLGQGAVLTAAGWWLARRGFELARLLVLGGLSAMTFGLLFGSVFAREDLIPALWIHPLEAPITVLAVPLLFAVLLLSLGQLLDALGALWHGELRRWLLRDLGFLVLYLGLVGSLLRPGLVWAAFAGGLWYLTGSFLIHRRLLGALTAFGHLLESGMQILVNTLSFARVGAFALAHASLSAAVVTMAEAAPWWGTALILVLGNAFIIGLEGLAVSIQTTRLVLFEFFNRFLRGTGRVFRPLPAPPEVVGISR